MGRSLGETLRETLRKTLRTKTATEREGGGREEGGERAGGRRGNGGQPEAGGGERRPGTKRRTVNVLVLCFKHEGLMAYCLLFVFVCFELFFFICCLNAALCLLTIV